LNGGNFKVVINSKSVKDALRLKTRSCEHGEGNFKVREKLDNIVLKETKTKEKETLSLLISVLFSSVE
jgi:hypothetical protein